MRTSRSFSLPSAIAVTFSVMYSFGTSLEASGMPGVLTYVASPSTRETRVTLGRQADRIVIIDDVTHATVARGRADRIQHVIVRGVDGDHNDTLTVNFSGGLSLPGGIDFDGGAAGFDTLRIVGGSSANSRHIPTNRSDGVVQFGATEIRYRNLEPITDTTPALNYTFNFFSNTASLTFQDSGGMAQFFSPTASFETTTIANKGAITIGAQGNSDTVTLAASVWADLVGVPVTVTGSGTNETLIVDLTGATSPNLPVTNNAGTLSGVWTFGNRPSVTFSGIQSLNPDDLSVTTSGPASVFATSNISYTITVSNAGPNTAAGVTVTDVLPANTTFVSATPSQGSCSGTVTVACSLGLMASGGSATITLVLHVNSGAAVSNTATVTASTTDPNPANNSSTSNAAVSPVNTPTLSVWGLAVFAALLAGCGAILYRRARGGGTALGI